MKAFAKGIVATIAVATAFVAILVHRELAERDYARRRRRAWKAYAGRLRF